jgi:hypothetical protein
MTVISSIKPYLATQRRWKVWKADLHPCAAAALTNRIDFRDLLVTVA